MKLVKVVRHDHQIGWGCPLCGTIWTELWPAECDCDAPVVVKS